MPAEQLSVSIDLSPFDGEVDYDGPSVEAAADDFGHLVRRVPRAVVRPHSGQDVAVAMHFAAQHGSQIAARGQGHSCTGARRSTAALSST
jgi:cytokinin dehydrogenase